MHKMIPAEQSGPRLTPEFGPSVLEHNESIQNLMETLNKRYITQGGRTFGEFSKNQNNYPISLYLENKDIINQTENFYDLSQDILNHLVSKASATSATGGWVVMCFYKQSSEHVLAVAVVNETTGASIDTAFKVQPSIYIDLTNLRHAGRINLTKWKNGKTGYVNFIKGARESTYFKEFLGCESTNSNVEESNKVIVAIRAYCDHKAFNYTERKTVTDLAHDWLKAAAKAKSPIYLAHLANHLAPENPEELTSFLVSDEYAINDHFVPDARTLKQLIELHTKDKYWDIKLSKDAFVHGAVYDLQTNTLTIPIKNAEDQKTFIEHVDGLNDESD